MLTFETLQTTRNQLIRDIDEAFGRLARQLESVGEESEPVCSSEGHDSIYPLSYAAGTFKGKKPTYIVFGRERVEAYTWKMVFKEIMIRCNADVYKHRELMNLRGRVSGRTRAFLSDRPDGMRSPLQIDHKLYAETHYDTETLLRVLLHRILDVVHHDYSNIYIAVRND